MIGRAILSTLFIVSSAAPVPAEERRRNTWPAQYQTRSTAEMVALFESPTRPVFRYRVAVAGLLKLEPGMTVADVGAGSGYFARLLAKQVGPTGRVFATELDPRMVAHIEAQAKAEHLDNLRAVQGEAASTGLPPASLDAVALLDTFSYLDEPDAMLKSIAAALEPGGLMMIVDLPREGQGASQIGIDADEVTALAAAAGFKHVDEVSLVPGQYVLRFRKP
jgi:ubiquinone/menaquinone biosynthesis C-methylase UbiE